MVEIRSFAELLADLGRLGSSFRSLIACPGEDSIKHWYRLREDGNTILNHMRYHSAINRMGLFKSVPKFERLGVNGASARSCYFDNDPLFKGLVGFELEPRYRSFKAESMFRIDTIFLDGSRFTRELCFSSGLIFQPVIAVDPEIASDSGKLWIEHKFELLDRCARGCEMLIDIIEKETAPPQQADNPNHADNQADENGVIDAVARSMIWGNDKFNDIPPRGIKVLSLLLDAYRDGNRVVTLGEIEELEVSVDGGMIDQVFRVKGKRHPVSKIIDNLRGGRYRLKPPRKNT